VYVGSAAPNATGIDPLQVLQPVYWFVDLLANFTVTNVLVTAGGATTNASVYIGSDSGSVLANTRVAVSCWARCACAEGAVHAACCTCGACAAL